MGASGVREGCVARPPSEIMNVSHKFIFPRPPPPRPLTIASRSLKQKEIEADPLELTLGEDDGDGPKKYEVDHRTEAEKRQGLGRLTTNCPRVPTFQLNLRPRPAVLPLFSST